MKAFEQAEKTVALLKEKGIKITFAESCTGGLAAKLVTDVSGASEIFDGSVVSYANEIKAKVLGVDSDILEKYGAVSAPVAVMMARGVRALMKSDIGVGITGIAGPNGDGTKKPVGLIYIALCDGEDTLVREIRNTFDGDDVREKNRNSAAFEAFKMAEEYARLYPKKPVSMRDTQEIINQYRD